MSFVCSYLSQEGSSITVLMFFLLSSRFALSLSRRYVCCSFTSFVFSVYSGMKFLYAIHAMDPLSCVLEKERNAMIRNRYNYLTPSIPRHQKERSNGTTIKTLQGFFPKQWPNGYSKQNFPKQWPNGYSKQKHQDIHAKTYNSRYFCKHFFQCFWHFLYKYS